VRPTDARRRLVGQLFHGLATKPPAPEALLAEAPRHIKHYGIAGVPSHSNGNFMQWAEGPSPAAKKACVCIRLSRRHMDLIELLNERVRSGPQSTRGLGCCRRSGAACNAPPCFGPRRHIPSARRLKAGV